MQLTRIFSVIQIIAHTMGVYVAILSVPDIMYLVTHNPFALMLSRGAVCQVRKALTTTQSYYTNIYTSLSVPADLCLTRFGGDCRSSLQTCNGARYTHYGTQPMCSRSSDVCCIESAAPTTPPPSNPVIPQQKGRKTLKTKLDM